MDRDEFGRRQADMTARWYEHVRATHGDVDAYIAKRQDAYLDRWKEAGRFIGDGAAVLDIGGGNLCRSVVRYFIDRRFKYDYVDVDPSAVTASSNFAYQIGLRDAGFRQGYNDKLDFPDGAFDAVFSSHCIEHSIDLVSTFYEVNRVLKVGGNFMMAVPLGWEVNPEHPYFFGPNEWVSLVEDAGFRIRVAQIGSEYPESGQDLFIAAQKTAPAPKYFRIDPSNYRKTSFSFASPGDVSIAYSGEFEFKGAAAISAASDWRISIRVPAGGKEILPILTRHPWSGIVECKSSVFSQDVDLYSWHHYDMPFRLPCSLSYPEMARLSSKGKNPASRWSQIGFLGYFWR